MGKSYTRLATDIIAADNRAKYDNAVKRLLVHKSILAYILKACVEDYRDLTLAQIADCIEGAPEISRTPVHRDEPDADEIAGMNVEDPSIREGVRLFDIRFTAVVPKDGAQVEVFINIEVQLDPQKSYPLEKRVVYYLCRMISAQYGPVFRHSEFGKIKKVYSIWIVPNPPRKRRNSIHRLSMTADDIYGDYCGDAEDSDLMSGYILSLSGDEQEAEHQTLRLLDVLLSSTKPPAEKHRILESDFDIPYTEQIRSEVEHMCNLSQGIYNDGRAEGRQEELLRNLRSLMRELGLSAQRAMDVLRVPAEDRETFERLLAR